ncbi:class II fructose-bisphosphate aldolase [Thalassotalea sp. LPB0316]|uniref:class II fructose-bisphosphate aldolase n=1 Tax=Thalassotalea sp. LPB0316 TaxID=2769490 RepID=UPI00186916E2|nr:class II fructose-bisphosphate aldolase [Thalassotalea sp. LPB0316]QOL26679.1 class II fructose-bisphosphate aldolase [Thalassotalea sp. LPB0316]
MERLSTLVAPGVATQKDVKTLLDYAKANNFAYPAVNVIGSHSINATLAAAKEVNSPIIIQLSHGGASFFLGKSVGLSGNDAAVAGAIAAAHYVHQVAKYYGIPVILHTDHAARELLPWIDGMLEASEAHFKATGKPLFSSHMIDLSVEPLQENVETCRDYLARMTKMGMTLEIELGCTGGEEDGVDNSHLDSSALYTQPEDVAYAYEVLNAVSEDFTIAASFGNVHGVYKPGNVKLTPMILHNSQHYVEEKFGLAKKPLNFVFHGGSGSELSDIRDAIDYGVIKMNIDTDTQWATWEGVKNYYDDNQGYLQGQIGNPDGDDKPNKKYYDPRAWLKHAEQSMTKRLVTCFDDLNCLNRY